MKAFNIFEINEKEEGQHQQLQTLDHDLNPLEEEAQNDYNQDHQRDNFITINEEILSEEFNKDLDLMNMPKFKSRTKQKHLTTEPNKQ